MLSVKISLLPEALTVAAAGSHREETQPDSHIPRSLWMTEMF